MSDIVVDASALVFALVGNGPRADVVRHRLRGSRLHAPHLIDAEVGNVLRRHERAKLISPAEAQAGLLVGEALIGHRYPHTGVLAQRAWKLRRNLSHYDALYIGLADWLDVPLLTGDARLASGPQLGCEIQLI